MIYFIFVKIERYLRRIKYGIFDERVSTSIARKISWMRMEIIFLRKIFISLNAVLFELA
jgi:hypothetical protein